MLGLLLDVLSPVRCAVCGEATTELCSGCAARLGAPEPRGTPPGVDAVVALCDYGGAGRDLVLAVKRRPLRGLARLLGAAMAPELRAVLRAVGDEPAATRDTAAATDPPALTWAPTTAARRRARGFDQAEVLAGGLGAATGWPVRPLLVRRGAPQLHAWRSGTGEPAGCPNFALRRPSPATVVVVDDVVTTGATVAAAAAELRRGGARAVVVAAVARTA